MGRIVSALFNEDKDSSGGAQALAAALNQVGGLTLFDADTIQLPNSDGMSIVGITTVHEALTSPAGLGFLHLPGKMGERKYRIDERHPVVGNAPLFARDTFPPGQFPVPAGQKMKYTAPDIGAAAEQHACIVDFFHPGLPDIPTLGVSPCPKGIIKVGMKTGTCVVSSISGLSSIQGDIVAYEDSEIQLPTDKNSLFALLKLGGYPTLVNMIVMGVRSPDGLSDRLIPAVLGTLGMGVDFDIGWVYSGDSAPKLVGCGAVTTSTEGQLTIGLL